MLTNRVDVCVIEDDAAQRSLLVRKLVREGYSVVEASDGEEGLRLLRQHHPHVVVCDLEVPLLDGVELCRAIRSDETLDGTYVMLVSANPDRDLKHRGLNAGADDYLIKPYDDEEFYAHLRNGLRVNRLQERLLRAAITDGLTGLWNHGHFRHLLDREFLRTRRYGGTVSLLMLDLDHFKAVNDTYGHEVGNQVLKSVARHLSLLVRDIDVVARYGGEEFAVICPQTGLTDAAQLGERIRRAIGAGVRAARHPHLAVTISVGVASSSDARVGSVADLINRADEALYYAKRRGRNQVVRCDQFEAPAPQSDVQVTEIDRLQKQVYELSMQAKELCLQSVSVLVQALEARDRFTAWHSRNTTFFAAALVESTEWPDPLRTATVNAAMLHNLGRIGVPDSILNKSEPLIEPERAILRQVPLLTCKILEPLRVFETEILIIRHLRERYDGAGYPDRLTGPHTPIGARLLAVAEAFESLTADRAYRPRRDLDEALRVIQADSGKHFDPQFVDLLEQVLKVQRARWRAYLSEARDELLHEIVPAGGGVALLNEK